MNFKSHKYTVPFLVDSVRSIKTTPSTKTFSGFVDALSPRKGKNSVQYKALNRALGGKLKRIIDGDGGYQYHGATPRARVLNFLKKIQ